MSRLVIKNVVKTFPGVKAVDGVSLDIAPGEIHALIGENGAGKSTLMHLVAGVYAPDSGSIALDGEALTGRSEQAMADAGIAMVFQERSLVGALSVAENIYAGRQPANRFGIISKKPMLDGAARILADLEVDIDPRTSVDQLSPGQQQMVEIAKALSFNSKVLIMDEPTAALTETEIDELFRLIRQLQATGVGVVYISHRLEELQRISDRITVMRDGRYIDTIRTADATIDRIISMMVGRTIYESAPEIAEDEESQPVVLEVRNLNRGKSIQDVNFTLRCGEILGFGGLMAAGRTEVARAIFGADAVESGEIFVKGKKVRIHSPNDAVAHGIGYLSEDRKRYGLALGMDVESNVVLASLKEFLNAIGFVQFGKTRITATKYVDALQIKTPSLQQTVRNLSGGNQQKVLFAKWLLLRPKILLADEPTRGVDVGAKAEIYAILRREREQGAAILIVSSDLEEVMTVADRIGVMVSGRLVAVHDAGSVGMADIVREIGGGSA